MAKSKKPLVVVTRKLPDSVETRMRELFDTRLNLDDKPMSQGQLAEAMKTADVLVPPGPAGQDRGGVAGDLLGKPRSDAGPHGHHLDQLPAHAGDLPSALGAPPQAAPAAGLCGQHRAGRGDRRGRAHSHDRGWRVG